MVEKIHSNTMTSYKTLYRAIDYQFEIKKSRFISRIEPIQSHEQGLKIVADLWAEYPDARHICYAMLVNGQVRMSDDGEPSGTAARPMLNVLQHQGLDYILATTVRYFGGIKLGAGGLVRAYSQSISEPMRTAKFSEIKPQSTAVIRLTYEYEPLLRQHIATQELESEFNYDDAVTTTLKGEKTKINALLTELNSQMKGCLDILDSP